MATTTWRVNGGLVHGLPGQPVKAYEHGAHFTTDNDNPADAALVAELRMEHLPEEQRKYRQPILMTEAEFLPPAEVTALHANELADRDATIAALRQQLEDAQRSGAKRSTLKEPPNATEE